MQCVRIFKLAADNAGECADTSVEALAALQHKARLLLHEMQTVHELARHMFVLAQTPHNQPTTNQQARKQQATVRT